MHIGMRNPGDTASESRGVSVRNQRRVTALTAVVLLAIAFGFYAYQHAVENSAKAALSIPRPAVAVEVAEARIERTPQVLSGIGTLQAMHQVTISPEVGGRVVKLFFDSGAKVKAGDPLLQLYDAPLRGDLANFEAQRQLATLNLKRGQELQSKDFQSRQSLDQQQATLDQAIAGAAKTRAQIEQMLIRAPFSGDLGVRQTEVGAYLLPGAPIVTLTDTSMLLVNFTLPEQVVNQVHVGHQAHIRADAFPDRVFDATITAIEPQISAQTRTLLVQATLPNPDRALLPGMFAKAEAVVSEEMTALVVPETAVDYSLYGEAAYVLNETKDESGKPAARVKRAVVKTGARFDGKVVILSGLNPGDKIVATGQVRLTDGAAVTVAPGGPALSNKPATDRY